ncbi:MAG: hypothetical protein AAF355_07955 [Myxococcota bacterium]
MGTGTLYLSLYLLCAGVIAVAMIVALALGTFGLWSDRRKRRQQESRTKTQNR